MAQIHGVTSEEGKYVPDVRGLAAHHLRRRMSALCSHLAHASSFEIPVNSLYVTNFETATVGAPKRSGPPLELAWSLEVEDVNPRNVGAWHPAGPAQTHT